MEKKKELQALIACDAKYKGRRVKHFVSVSGGKDSTATLLKAKEALGSNFTAIFCDTGNEHSFTYDYIDYLNDKIHPIKKISADFTTQIIRKRKYIKEKWAEKGVSDDIIKAALNVVRPTGNPFLDLCLWKGRFPYVVHWSRTSWGGKQVDMFRMPVFESKCTSVYGLCE